MESDLYCIFTTDPYRRTKLFFKPSIACIYMYGHMNEKLNLLFLGSRRKLMIRTQFYNHCYIFFRLFNVCYVT